MPVLVKIPNFGSGGGVVPVLTTGVEMAPNGTRASARDLRTQPGASEPSPIKSRYVVLRWSRFFEISGFCRASSAGKDTEMSVEIARSGLAACAHPGAGQRSHRERSQRRWWRSVVAVLWRPPGAHLYGGGGRKFEIVPTSPDRVPVALGLSAGLVHSEKCEKLRDPTVGRWCFGRLPHLLFVWGMGDCRASRATLGRDHRMRWRAGGGELAS